MRTRWFLAVILSTLLAACGGGSDGDGATPSDSSGNPPSSGSGNGGSSGGDSNGGGTGGDDGGGDDDGGPDTPPTQPDPAPGDPPPTSGGGDGDGDAGGGDGSSDTPAPGPLTDIRFNNPTGIAADGNGNLYVIDGETSSNRIRRIAPDGSVTTLVSVSGRHIHGVAASPSGDVFYSTEEGTPFSGNPGNIWRIDNGTPVQILATSSGASTYMTVDPDNGDLYVPDSGEMKRISRDGTVTTLFSTGGAAGPITLHNGVLWVHLNFVGREGSLARWTESGGLERMYSTTLGQGLVSTDAGIYVAKFLYQRADSYWASCTVDLFNPDTLQLTNVAGGEGEPCGYLDGTGQAARFDFTRSTLTLGSDGNLYVTDYTNDVIRRVTPAGVVTTYAGVPSGGVN